MKTISRYIMTLALLLTAVTGAWAISDPNAVYWDYQTWNGWTESVTTHTVGDITITATGSGKVYQSESSGEPLALQAGANDAITFTSNSKPFASIAIMTDDELNVAGWTYNSSTRSYEWSGEPTTSVTLSGCDINADYIIFTFGTAEAPITVEPVTGQQNQWTFTMPGSDVVLTPQYAPAAKWDVVENLEQLPAALEGIIAGQDAAIVNAGQSAQGTVMYAVTTSAEAAPELSAFSATVPTAKDYDDATTLYVWYYIQGQDTPDGQEATEENTFNDTEICTTPLTVQVLSNKFDITFNAANANTIESDKATVTVDDQPATVTEGKLQGVKMGSEVKLEAKPGYKFRKVEVKKGAEAPAITLDNTMTAWTAGKYAVPAGGLTYSAAITVSGNVTLVLTDGETLTLNKGISLAEGATLTVEGNGTMNVNGTNESTASTVAGTGTLVLTSGTLNAKGGNGQSLTLIQDSWKWDGNTGASGGVAINGNVTVSGGTVTATGGNGGNLNTVELGFSENNRGGNGGAAISGSVTVNAGGWTATNGSNGTYTGGDDSGCYAGTGGKAVAGTVTDNR